MKLRIPTRYLALLLLLWFCGCASLGTYNAATGRREFIIIPTNEEVAMGEKMHQQVISQYPLSSRQDQVARVEKIGQRLAQVSERQDYTYHFFLVESKELNAFTIPGGRVYIFTGLMDRLTSDDQIAAVLAHEIGHCAARHTVKKFQASVGYDLIGGIILNRLGMQEQVQQLVTLSSNALMQLVFSAYSRHDEYEADHLGLRYMDWARYDVQGMIETFEVLEKEAESSSVPLILRSHPYVKDRITAVKTEIEKMKADK